MTRRPATTREIPARLIGGPKDGQLHFHTVAPGTDSICYANPDGPSDRYEYVDERAGEALFRYAPPSPRDITGHVADCRWILTTNVECEYRATHRYCPHPEHACTCPEGCTG